MALTLLEGQGQSSGSRSGSRSKVRVNVKGRVMVKGQSQGHRSSSNFPRAAVDIRGSALPCAAKSNKSHYQFKVFVCVSVISGRMRIIVQRRSIGVLILLIFYLYDMTTLSMARKIGSLGKASCLKQHEETP